LSPWWRSPTLPSAVISAFALPFVILARREHASSDPIEHDGDEEPSAVDPGGEAAPADKPA
jgi:hypothetical protein